MLLSLPPSNLFIHEIYFKRSFLKIIQISLSDDKKLNGSFT